jgi:hypothetical protein
MIYMSPRIVARFDRFSIGLGDLVFVSLGSQLRVVFALVNAACLKDECFFGWREKILRS